MATAPITEYVDITLLPVGAVGEAFGFDRDMFLVKHDNGSDRLMGPYTQASDLEDAGFTEDDNPSIFAYVRDWASQEVKGSAFFIGRWDDGGETVTEALSAVEAAGVDDFYGVVVDSYDDAEILAAAGWVQQRNGDSLKFGFFRTAAVSALNKSGPIHNVLVTGTASDGAYDIVFTGFGLASPVTIRVTRATTPATNADIADALRDLIATEIDAGGDLENVVISEDGTGANVHFTFAAELPDGVVTVVDPGAGTLTHTIPDTALWQQMKAALYDQCTLNYHHNVANYYLDGAVGSRAGGFKLDQPGGVGALAYKPILSVPFTVFAQSVHAVNLRQCNVNYYAKKRGLQFYFPGVTPRGAPYFADIKWTMHWFRRRTEEALIAEWVGEPNKIGYDQAGITRLAGVVQKVLDRGVIYGHWLGDVGFAPVVIVPLLKDIPANDKMNRVLSLTSKFNKATFTGAIQQVTYTTRVSFGDDA